MERSSGSGTRIRVRDPPTLYDERTTAVTMSTSATTSVHRVELDGPKLTTRHRLGSALQRLG
eukprot:505586-Prymnesium_polylepis.1